MLKYALYPISVPTLLFISLICTKQIRNIKHTALQYVTLWTHRRLACRQFLEDVCQKIK